MIFPYNFPYKPIDLTHALDGAIPTWTGGCGFHNDKSTIPGNRYRLNDDLVLSFTKKLR